MAFIWFVPFLTKNPWEVIGNLNELFRNLPSVWSWTPLRSATHACNLLDTGLADIFNIQLDWRHKIVALQLSTQNVVNKVPLSTVPGFKTRAFVQHMESGPTPDTASFIQKMEEEKLAKVHYLNTFREIYVYYILIHSIFCFAAKGRNEGQQIILFQVSCGITVWKKQKFSHTKIIFRQIYYLPNSFVKLFISLHEILPNKYESKFP